MKILVTGGTGFIGKKVVRLLEPEVEKIFLLVRKRSLEKAKKAFPNSKKIQIIEGDILSNDVCSHVEDVNLLSESVSHVLHLAAYYDLAMNVLDAYTHNVIGVQNVLNLSRKLKSLVYFHHISTYAVNGSCGGRIQEQDFFIDTPFPDHYSKSKMQGEHLVRTMQIGDVKKRIYRPGIVVGDSQTGEIEKIDGPYYFLKFMHEIDNYHHWIEKLGFLPLPFGPKTIFPIVPVDILAEWISESVLRPTPEKELKTYHFIGKNQISLKNFIEQCLAEIGINCSVVRVKRNNLYKHLFPKMGMPKELMPYMFMEASFDTSERRKDFPNHREYLIEEMISRLVKGGKIHFREGS
ncbi:MAG: SDR family oxidoreductase [Bacteriovoracaceae bacterium]